jgi:hypothetical protein
MEKRTSWNNVQCLLTKQLKIAQNINQDGKKEDQEDAV